MLGRWLDGLHTRLFRYELRALLSGGNPCSSRQRPARAPISSRLLSTPTRPVMVAGLGKRDAQAAPRSYSRISFCCGKARDVGTGAADPSPLHDGGPPPRAREVPRQQLTSCSFPRARVSNRSAGGMCFLLVAGCDWVGPSWHIDALPETARDFPEATRCETSLGIGGKTYRSWLEMPPTNVHPMPNSGLFWVPVRVLLMSASTTPWDNAVAHGEAKGARHGDITV